MKKKKKPNLHQSAKCADFAKLADIASLGTSRPASILHRIAYDGDCGKNWTWILGGDDKDLGRNSRNSSNMRGVGGRSAIFKEMGANTPKWCREGGCRSITSVHGDMLVREIEANERGDSNVEQL